MSMEYTSTRNDALRISASEAIVKGISDDGGLFVPVSIPLIDKDFSELSEYDYPRLASYIIRKFLGDFTDDEIDYCVKNAYNTGKFDEGIVGIKKCDKDCYLELFHGKTIAFKDMALSILPYFMTTAANKQNIKDKIVILAATSGDTGKAALEGFSDVEGTEVIVFYPKEGVSNIQELQMLTQKGGNVRVIGVHGNFDDAQTGVKKALSDDDIKAKMKAKGRILSSANSINIGRLVSQIVYYVYAYLQLLKYGSIEQDEKINITVPTGNFGNILAAYYAKQMGLPVNKLICASNVNNVLTDFFSFGKYDRNRKFYTTISPSMDILISSNLERLLYHLSKDSNYVVKCMNDLKESGTYEINDRVKNGLSEFWADFATDDAAKSEIKRVYDKYSYVIDTHTAVASCVNKRYADKFNDGLISVIASTASCYKFLRDVYPCISKDNISKMTDFEIADKMAFLSKVEIPVAVSSLKNAKILHNEVVGKDEILSAIVGE